MSKEKIKVYLYTRVSTAMQIDGYSLEAQKTKMKAFCDYNEYEIAGEYEDAGKSGKSIEGRIAFNQMMDDIKSGKDEVSYVLVLLSHKKPDGHINVKVEFGEDEEKVPRDDIAQRAESYKPKERVTYKMIKEYIEVKYGFKVHTAYIAEVKRDLGLPMYDAPNAVEELKQPRKHPTAEKVEAIKDALKRFEVI